MSEELCVSFLFFADASLQDDIGVSGVIGSAVFNITLVIAVCALAAEQVTFRETFLDGADWR